MSKKENWQVRLGEQEWVRYTYARPEGDPLQLLGSVKKGAQIGALGLNAEGQYVQVVGDQEIALNRSQIQNALSKIKGGNTGYVPARPMLQRAPSVVPTVIIKRRRVIVPSALRAE